MAVNPEPGDVEIRMEALKRSVKYLGDVDSRSPKRAMVVAEWFATYLKTGEIT